MGRARLAYEPRSNQCIAHKRDKSPCNNMAIRGSKVCRMHGGSTMANRKASAERVAVAKAENKIAHFLATVPHEPVDNPLEALRDLAGEIVAVKDWLRTQVEYLSTESAVQGEQVSAVMQLYSAFIDKSEKTLVNIARLNIDERLAHIQAVQAQIMVTVLIETLQRLEIEKPKQEQAKVIMGKMLEKYDR